MIEPKELYYVCKSEQVSFFTGVPDSLLKSFVAHVTENSQQNEHVIAANEGGAIALATGHYLATGEYALVYLQNSGLGNAINPLLSLADPEVYSIPMLLMVGWRGEPGQKDEPQHMKQGRVTLDLLKAMEIPYIVIGEDSLDWKESVMSLCREGKSRQGPVAIVVETGIFEPYKVEEKDPLEYLLTREQALAIIVDELDKRDIIVSTTGKISRELFELRDIREEAHTRDFLMVGSMGHSSQIALGIALRKPDNQVFCLDGDGAVLMHMGALAIIGQIAPMNLKHILLNNGAHDSVGGQPTAGLDVDFVALARATGYKRCIKATTAQEIQSSVRCIRQEEGPCFLEVVVRKGARQNLGRPTMTPFTNRNNLMKELLNDGL